MDQIPPNKVYWLKIQEIVNSIKELGPAKLKLFYDQKESTENPERKNIIKEIRDLTKLSHFTGPNESRERIKLVTEAADQLGLADSIFTVKRKDIPPQFTVHLYGKMSDPIIYFDVRKIKTPEELRSFLHLETEDQALNNYNYLKISNHPNYLKSDKILDLDQVITESVIPEPLKPTVPEVPKVPVVPQVPKVPVITGPVGVISEMYLEPTISVEGQINLKEHLDSGKEISDYLWSHVCRTVCSNDPYYKSYPHCNCNPVGEKIAKSMVRNAVSRIFADPYQSIMEPVVNGFDSYSKGASTSIGKFGMGFFSFLVMLLKASPRGQERSLVITTKQNDNNYYYQVEISLRKPVSNPKRENERSHGRGERGRFLDLLVQEIRGGSSMLYGGSNSEASTDELFFTFKKVSNAGSDIESIVCPEIVELFDPNKRSALQSGTTMELKGPLTPKDLEGFTYHLERLRYFPSAQLYLNGKPVNKVSTGQGPGTLSSHCVSVLLDTNRILIQDLGSGMSLNTILRSLLVPAISTKTVQVAKEVSPHRKTGLVWLDKGDQEISRFLITVGGVVIVEVKLPPEKLYPNLNPTMVEILNRAFPPIVLRLDLPENTRLPVARDDVLFTRDTVTGFLIGLSKLAEELSTTYGSLVPLQKGLEGYRILSAQKNKVRDLIASFNNSTGLLIQNRNLLVVPPKMACFLLKYNMTGRNIIVSEEHTPDEVATVDLVFPKQEKDSVRFAERRLVYLPNYLIKSVETLGTRLHLFLPERYKSEDYTEYLRNASSVFLTKGNSIYNELEKTYLFTTPGKTITDSLKQFWLTYAIYYGYMTDLVSRFASIVIPVKEYVFPIINTKSQAVGWAKCYLNVVTRLLIQLRTIRLTSHHTYGGGDKEDRIIEKFVGNTDDAIRRFPYFLLDVESSLIDRLLKDFDLFVESQSSHIIMEIMNMNWLTNIFTSPGYFINFKNLRTPMATLYLSCLYYMSDTEFEDSTKHQFLPDLKKDLKELLSQTNTKGLEQVDRYLEGFVNVSILTKDIANIFMGYGASRPPNVFVITNIIDILKKAQSPGYQALPQYHYQSLLSTAPQRYQFPLSLMITEILKLQEIPKNLSQYQDFFTRLNQKSGHQSTDSNSINSSSWQVIELAINAGTTIEATEMAITEAVQNSLDAIRLRGTGSGKVSIKYGKLVNSPGYYFSIEDDVGIAPEAISALSIPYYSQKVQSTLTTGEMGNGLFNIYRDATEVEITTRSRDLLTQNTNAFTILDVPQRKPDQTVSDIQKTVVFTADRKKLSDAHLGTVISVKLPLDEQKFGLTFLNLNNALEKLLTISPTIAELDINAEVSNKDLFLPGQINFSYSGSSVIVKISGHNPTIQSRDDFAVSLHFFKNENFNSYLQTRGVPFQLLSTFVEQTFPELHWINPFLKTGILINIHGGFSPVQSRSKITLESAVHTKLRELIKEAVFLKYWQNGQLNQHLLNYESSSDPNQIKFNTGTQIDSGRLDHFLSFYRPLILDSGRESLAVVINMQIASFSLNPDTYRYQSPYHISNEYFGLNNKLVDIINGWFKLKTIKPCEIGRVVEVAEVVPSISKQIKETRKTGSTSLLKYEKQILGVVKTIIDMYIRLYFEYDERLQVKPTVTPPTVQISITPKVGGYSAFYMRSSHTINVIIADEASRELKFGEWLRCFQAIRSGQQDYNQKYKDYFGKTSHCACLLDHELLHARKREDSSTDAKHGVQTIQFGTNPPTTQEFEETAILTRTKMDNLGLTPKFLAVIQQIVPDIKWDDSIHPGFD